MVVFTTGAILGAGAVGIVGTAIGNFLGGAGETKKQISTTSTYAPQTTTSEIYAPAQTYTYAPQYASDLQVQISSPQAQQTTKKELRSEITSSATATPTVSQRPSQQIPISTAQGQTSPDMMGNLIIIAAVLGGGYILLNTGKKKK